MKNTVFRWLLKGFVFIPGILFIICSCHSYSDKKLQTEIDNIAARFVPDRRVGICTIKLESGKKGTLILRGETTNPEAKKEIIKTLYNQGITVVDSIISAPDTTVNAKSFGLVTLSVINLRKEPDHTSELVSQAKLGTPVLILKNKNSWVQIQTPDNYISWTEASSVKLLNKMEMDVWKNSERLIYMDNSGWLHDNPSINSGVEGDLVGGCIMKRTGELKGYFSVELPDGRTGFIEKQKVMNFNDWKRITLCTEESICRVARTFLGLPYLWGGSSTKAVDCSGLVQSVYFMNGLILQRDASLQALHGSVVDISNGYSRLKKGDLLFFGSNVNGIHHVTHVAIYMGNMEYINSSGRVMINSLDSTQTNYNRKRINSLLSAKRNIGVENDPGIVPVFKHPWY
jgi:Cell wall-associated hydrolases (invasion-associated proteins)